MKLNLQGKTALVTGSTSGIGKAIASSLAEEGAAVIVNGRREEKVNQTIDELKTQHAEAVLYPAAFDLGTEEGCNELFQAYPELIFWSTILGFLNRRSTLIFPTMNGFVFLK